MRVHLSLKSHGECEKCSQVLTKARITCYEKSINISRSTYSDKSKMPSPQTKAEQKITWYLENKEHEGHDPESRWK